MKKVKTQHTKATFELFVEHAGTLQTCKQSVMQHRICWDRRDTKDTICSPMMVIPLQNSQSHHATSCTSVVSASLPKEHHTHLPKARRLVNNQLAKICVTCHCPHQANSGGTRRCSQGCTYRRKALPIHSVHCTIHCSLAFLNNLRRARQAPNLGRHNTNVSNSHRRPEHNHGEAKPPPPPKGHNII